VPFSTFEYDTVTTYDPPLLPEINIEYSEEVESEICTVCPVTPPFPSYLDLSVLRCGDQPPDGEDWPVEPDLLSGQHTSFDTSVSAYDLSIGGAISKYRSKYKIVHPPTGTCYLKVWLKKSVTTHRKVAPVAPNCVETWSLNDQPVVTEIIYEWNGTGQVCLSSPSKGARHCVNWITSKEYTDLLEPQPGQEMVIEIIKYSCVKNYNPVPDACHPNRFPPATPC